MVGQRFIFIHDHDIIGMASVITKINATFRSKLLIPTYVDRGEMLVPARLRFVPFDFGVKSVDNMMFVLDSYLLFHKFINNQECMH
jgi:hypothetical protein